MTFERACLERWKLSPERCQQMWLDFSLTQPAPPPAPVIHQETHFYNLNPSGDPLQGALIQMMLKNDEPTEP